MLNAPSSNSLRWYNVLCGKLLALIACFFKVTAAKTDGMQSENQLMELKQIRDELEKALTEKEREMTDNVSALVKEKNETVAVLDQNELHHQQQVRNLTILRV